MQRCARSRQKAGTHKKRRTEVRLLLLLTEGIWRFPVLSCEVEEVIEIPVGIKRPNEERND